MTIASDSFSTRARVPALLAAAVFAAALAGCANTKSETMAPAAPVAVAPEPMPAPAPAPPAPPPAPLIDVASNPVLVIFNPENTDAPAELADFTGDLAARAQESSRVVITGFADRLQPGVSRNIAMARANVVRNALVKAGVPANRIQVKTVTNIADKHVVELAFTEKKGRAAKR